MPYKTTSENELWNNGVVLSFDLYTAKLKTYYSSISPQGAYAVLKTFLMQNGFCHKHDSDYIHTTIDKADTSKLIYDFANKHKWFPLCLNKMNISPNIKKLDIAKQIIKLSDEQWKKEKDIENQRLAENQLGKPLDLINSNEAEL